MINVVEAQMELYIYIFCMYIPAVDPDKLGEQNTNYHCTTPRLLVGMHS